MTCMPGLFAMLCVLHELYMCIYVSTHEPSSIGLTRTDTAADTWTFTLGIYDRSFLILDPFTVCVPLSKMRQQCPHDVCRRLLVPTVCGRQFLLFRSRFLPFMHVKVIRHLAIISKAWLSDQDILFAPCILSGICWESEESTHRPEHSAW